MPARRQLLDLDGRASLFQLLLGQREGPFGLIDVLAVDGDRNRLRQVLANLVGNALKYTPSGGEVTVAAHREDSDAVLTVADTGVGIDPGDLPRVWDRLFRGDRSRSERGLGLGLPIAKRVIIDHNGRMDIDTGAGGTTVTLVLPAIEESK